MARGDSNLALLTGCISGTLIGILLSQGPDTLAYFLLGGALAGTVIGLAADIYITGNKRR